MRPLKRGSVLPCLSASAGSAPFPDPFNERRVLASCEAFVQDFADSSHVAAEHGWHVEPEAGENLTADDAGSIGCEGLVSPFAQSEPVDFFSLGHPDDVFLHAVGFVDLQLS